MPHATASTISLLQRSRLEDSEPASQPASHVLHGDSVKAVYSSHVALQVFVCNLQGETKQKHHGLLASSRWPTELPQPHSLRVSTDPRAPALGLCCSPRLPCDKPALLPGFFFLLPCDLTNLARMWAIRYRVEGGDVALEVFVSSLRKETVNHYCSDVSWYGGLFHCKHGALEAMM